jgi:adenosylcobinamide kinase/adenosylcobinamide-phosphate guanylyltransferase
VSDRQAAPGGDLLLVLGGMRSGKSAWAEQLARDDGRAVVYVATAQIGDAEMAERVAAHRARRPPTWTTLEAPADPAGALRAGLGAARVVLLDCVGMLVANALLAEVDPGVAATRVGRAIDDLLALVQARELRLIAVSSEVGLAPVPLTSLGRRYGDLLGDTNQRLAREARRCYLVVAGLPVELRALAGQLSNAPAPGRQRERPERAAPDS